MSVPANSKELLDLVRQSELVEPARLNQFLLRTQSGGGLPHEPTEAAGQLVKDGLITYFQAEQFLLGKWRGFTIGKYKLLERIGFGGMGQVFLCEHLHMKKRVAMKVLPPQKAKDPSALGRFYREARAAGLINHPNVAKTIDIDKDEDLHFLVMEYVDGSNLLDVVRRFGPMDVLRAAHYMQQAAEGLQHAFEAGLTHRDIKPGNLMVDRSGVLKVLDMGLARIMFDDQDNLTLRYDDKSVLGTADYVSPEQIINSHTADIRSDIYSLGATFYFLLAGKTMFPDGTVAQKIQWHQNKQPMPIREVRPGVPAGLATVLDRMLAKDAKQRYQTPGDVAHDLSEWTATPIPPPPDKEMPKLSPAAMEVIMAGQGTASTLARPAGHSSSKMRMPSRPGGGTATIAAPKATRGGVRLPSMPATAETARMSSGIEHTPAPGSRATPLFAPALPAEAVPAKTPTLRLMLFVLGTSILGTLGALAVWKWMAS